MNSLSKRELRGCRHFNGLMNDRCEANIAYKPFKGNMPCLPKYVPTDTPANSCPSFELYTEAEIDAQEAATVVAFKAYVDNLSNDICPHCHTPITNKRQVGRCVYADPCGCRLYQGRLDGKVTP